jgi:undecaprenyl phosphate N,N'-diacetylbacillosamine 1-phosphate transferase
MWLIAYYMPFTWKRWGEATMYRHFFKRLFDLIFALMAFPFWLIILIVVGPIIYLQDKGPIFYNAPRLGKDGKTFIMYKFRSMKVNAPDLRNEDGSTYSAEDDPRLTKVGKFLRRTSLDETPQLLNVIRGDMSLVGPRPDLPEQRTLYEGDEERKLKVRPGLTGYNQAYYRNSVKWKERIRHDLIYVDSISLWFDIKILLRTVIAVLRSEDIYVNQIQRSGGRRA